MKTIYYPGNMGQVSCADYGVAIENDGAISKAHIVFYQDKRHAPSTSLINTDKGRDIALNRVLENDLKGVRIDLIRFTVIFGDDYGDRLHSFSFPINVDIDDYVAKGNPCDVKQAPADDLRGVLLNLMGKGNKSYSFWSVNVVGGCARFYTQLSEATHLGEEEARALLTAAGFKD